MTRWISYLFVLGCALHVPNPASAQTAAAEDDSDARTLFNLGQRAYERGRFREALDYFQRSYALSHRPELLFNIGQAADRLREDQLALDSFEQYLRDVPNGPNQTATEARVQILRDALAAERAAEAARALETARAAEAPDPTPQVRSVPGEPTPAPAAALAATPEEDDGPSMTGIGMLAGGGVSLAFGATFLALGMKDIRAVEDAADGSSFSSVADAYDRAPTRTTVGFVMMGLGVGAGVAGLAISLAGGDDGDETALRLRVAPTACVLEGRF